MKMNSIKFLAGALLLTLAACQTTETPEGAFVKTDGAQFTLNGAPYYYIGTNMWYGAVLASEGEGGDRARLGRELDSLCQLGVRNLRILVGSEGIERERKVMPILQPQPGEYNDTLLAGLDYLMVEMQKRDMKAVLYLNNAWSWSGGYSTYLQWAGVSEQEILDSIPWHDWLAFGTNFALCKEAQRLFLNHVDFIVSRTNTLTGKPYADDPTIMSWQVGNEPRGYDQDPAVKDAFAAWVHETAEHIRAIDKNHLISIGSEGLEGCEYDPDLFIRLHADTLISYLTMHIWPQNWHWVERGTVAAGTDTALIAQQLAPVIANTRNYMQFHIRVADSLRKPIVLEEFGYPRDENSYDPEATTVAKDQYYAFMFGQVVESAKNGGALAGANFWAWNGEARRVHLWWKPYDPYMGDPAQEEQGLYGVFNSDNTCKVIKAAAEQLAL